MNRKKVAISLVVSIAALSIAGAVYGQVVPRGPSLASVQTRAAAQFDRLDVNLDGQIDTADRVAATRNSFAAADQDGNGALSPEEFAAIRDRGQMGEGRRGDRPERGGRDWGMRHGRGMSTMLPALIVADANRDAIITEDEYTTAITGFFERADANNDDVMTREEAMAQRTAMRAAAQQRMRAQRADAPAADAPAQ